ncbi:YeeE/YedE family protein [Qipengyuania vesicularis]|uniref:YeeE/YedE family protein n=1 Tax=Qipengyuania vesicularis TaxID=2867232 RepID=UPI001C8676A7|nr:YeeE/YedE thiosulfate transporter family protein [Qipengyuania vesicularis]MBX7526169.1 YeeE/YedE family protein [Qipengyuania vesicularis]
MIAEYFPDAMPLQGLIGGALIGLAAAVFLIGSGRIAGISGLFARSTLAGSFDLSALLFTVSLVGGAALVSLFGGGVAQTFPDHWGYLVAGGLVVGFGTRLGSGCTSGHGVCGMSRLSKRSITATVSFMAAGMATVLAMRALGLEWM